MGKTLDFLVSSTVLTIVGSLITIASTAFITNIVESKDSQNKTEFKESFKRYLPYGIAATASLFTLATGYNFYQERKTRSDTKGSL